MSKKIRITTLRLDEQTAQAADKLKERGFTLASLLRAFILKKEKETRNLL